MNCYKKVALVLIAVVGLAGCTTHKSANVELVSGPLPNQDSIHYVQQPILVTRTNSSEIQVLIRLVTMIEELEALVREAESSADPDARLRFDYYQLRTDFLSISQGIQAHIRTPVYTPRTLDPIAGNYGR